MRHPAVPVYAITLILSAFLLFSVQPMMARMVLPLLGGAPSVWNTAMVFFQGMLLAGYGYAHLTSRFMPVRAQAGLHIILLLGAFFFLPIAIPQVLAQPQEGANPILWQLSVMGLAIGVPFLILSGTAPMVQRWFAASSHKDSENPYFLYAASNFGSLAALIAYPLLIEVFLGTRMQAGIWTWLYGGLIAMLALCAALTGKKRIVETLSATGPAVTNGQRLVWIVLAFIPSSLLLSVTTYITTDIASAPLFWIIPLTLYLITFIMAFARRQAIGFSAAYLFLCALMTIVAMLFVKGIFSASIYPMAIHLALFFLAAFCAHTALSQRKPSAAHLTEFYLYISLGGVLGGMFNTFIAPAIFPVPFEYPLGLAAALFTPFLATGTWPQAAELKKNALILLAIAAVSVAAIFLSANLALIMLCCVLVLAGLMLLLDREAKTAFIAAICIIFLTHPGYDWSALKRTLLVERNFFGVSRVADSADKPIRTYMHGTTIHGAQALTEEDRLTPLTYYAPHGPAGDAFSLLSAPGPQKIAVLGLGTGSVACYSRAGRSFDFYEIDPAVIRIAENSDLFTFLSACGSPYRAILGDGRLKIAEAPDRSYDMIFIDTFSSDSIPAHIVTREAFALYFTKLKEGGILLMNISNRHLDLSPLLARAAQEFGAESRFVFSPGQSVSGAAPEIKSLDARYALITANPAIIARLRRDYPRWQPFSGKPARLWTDDYANILSLLDFKKQE